MIDQINKISRILILDHDSGLTGSTKSLIYLLRALKEEPVEVIIATRKNMEQRNVYSNYVHKIISIEDHVNLNFSQSNNLTILKPIGLYSIYLTFIRFIRGFFIGNKLIKSISPDLVFLNEYVLIQFAAAAKLKGKKTITYVRSQFFKGRFGLWGKLIKKIIFRFSDKIFVITNQELDQFYLLTKLKPNKFTIVREFLDEENFRIINDLRSIKKYYNIPENKFIVLMLGGIRRIKGSFELLQAANELNNRSNEFFFIIAGKVGNTGVEQKEYSQKCFNFIAENNLQNSVRITDEISEVSDVISAADVLVSTNTTSHFSRPIIEAWAKKKPVIASNHPHTREIVKDNENGLLYNPGDYLQLADKIMLLKEDKNLRSILGKNGFDLAKKDFLIDNNLKTIKNKILEV